MADDASSPLAGIEYRQIYRNGQIHLIGFIVCFLATVLLTKISSLLAPFNLYFTFTDLVKSGEGGYGLLPFFMKMLIPFSVGFAYFHFAKTRDSALLDKDTDKAINIELTAGAGASFGALLLSWPAIVLWEFVVSATIFTYRTQFYFVYFLYIISFAYISMSGVMAARFVWVQADARRHLRVKFKSQYQFVLLVWSFVLALATGGAADWATKHLGGG